MSLWKWLARGQPHDETYTEEAKRAEVRATEALENTRNMWPVVRETQTTIRRLRSQNGFSEAWTKALGGR
jgi:hypothetical protein